MVAHGQLGAADPATLQPASSTPYGNTDGFIDLKVKDEAGATMSRLYIGEPRSKHCNTNCNLAHQAVRQRPALLVRHRDNTTGLLMQLTSTTSMHTL